MKTHLGPLTFPEREKRQRLGLGMRRRRGSVRRKKQGSGLTSVALAEVAWLAKVPGKL